MFTKLFASITDSTIWDEESHVRIVWITMLAKSDQAGFVWASVPGLAKASRVKLEECLEALGRLKAPDEWSRSKEHGGRRIEEVDGGWLLLNYQKYRRIRNSEERREYIRAKVAAHRTKKHEIVNNVNNVNKCKHIAEAEAEEKKNTYSCEFEEFWGLYPKKRAKGNAYREWKRIKPGEELRAKIIAAVKAHVVGWTDLKYVKDPERWLKGECWEDGVGGEWKSGVEVWRSLDEYKNGGVVTEGTEGTEAVGGGI